MAELAVALGWGATPPVETKGLILHCVSFDLPEMYKIDKRNKTYHDYFWLDNNVYRGSTKIHYKRAFTQKIYNEEYLNQYNIKTSKVTISDFISRHLDVKPNTISRDFSYTKEKLIRLTPVRICPPIFKCHYLRRIQKELHVYLTSILVDVLVGLCAIDKEGGNTYTLT